MKYLDMTVDILNILLLISLKTVLIGGRFCINGFILEAFAEIISGVKQATKHAPVTH